MNPRALLLMLLMSACGPGLSVHLSLEPVAAHEICGVTVYETSEGMIARAGEFRPADPGWLSDGVRYGGSWYLMRSGGFVSTSDVRCGFNVKDRARTLLEGHKEGGVS